VDERVMVAARDFEKIGGQVDEISIPWHRNGAALFTAIAAEGGTAMRIGGNGLGVNWKGYYPTSLLDAFAKGLRTRAEDLSDTTKLIALTGLFMHERYHGRYYAKAQNLARPLRTAYDAALRNADLLVMPTPSQKATPLPPPACSREEASTPRTIFRTRRRSMFRAIRRSTCRAQRHKDCRWRRCWWDGSATTQSCCARPTRGSVRSGAEDGVESEHGLVDIRLVARERPSAWRANSWQSR
jgi:hypothetical protein